MGPRGTPNQPVGEASNLTTNPPSSPGTSPDEQALSEDPGITLEDPTGLQGGPLGLVMGGGGARAAYQVGFLSFLAKRYPGLQLPYITGVSAGAINAVHLAAHHGTFRQAVDELCSLWGNLTMDQVFRVDSGSLFKNSARWGFNLMFGSVGPRPSQLRSLVDTSPLKQFLTEALAVVDGRITGIDYNLQQGRLKAVALSTASYSTGQSVTWVQGRRIEQWERPNRISRMAELCVDHVMASAALPILFPAVKIEDQWYGDGGIRLTAPLSPAVHLGAERIIAISTKYPRNWGEADEHVIRGYPPLAQVVGVLFNSIFLDLLDQDAFRLQRINSLLDKVPADQRDGLRPLKLLVLRPSVDLGKLANLYEPELPRAFRYLTRNLGTRETGSPDALSLILFQPNFLQHLIDIGARDAEARDSEIQAFLEAEDHV